MQDNLHAAALQHRLHMVNILLNTYTFVAV
jgi:hypothetical protein